jgi:hypothetical protein
MTYSSQVLYQSEDLPKKDSFLNKKSFSACQEGEKSLNSKNKPDF